MKLVYKSIVILFLLTLSLSCEKTESSSIATEQKAADDNDLAQAPILMKNSQGEEATVVYFAKGEKVAIKITMYGEERVFEARGTSDTGGLVFSDGNSTWEMLDKISGKLTDKEGNVVMFRGEE
ncbi:MAG: hypothetical protein WCY77_07135 [Weeksellaceae bacterium]